MRFDRRTRLAAGTFGFVASLAMMAGLASADDLVHDAVYADSFGNLVVQSPYGYKRIIVGEGYRARQLMGYTQSSGPRVVYDNSSEVAVSNCYRPPMMWRGRSFMYGLPDGVVPQPPLICN